MKFNTRILWLAILISIATFVTLILWQRDDNGSLAATAACAVSGETNESIHRVTDTVFRMTPSSAMLCMVDPSRLPPHADYYCHVYVNDVGLTPMKTGKGEYALGSVVIKQKYSDRVSMHTELFTIMRKMDAGYDPENGDWEYSVVDSTGTKVLSSGRIESCIACHALYPETDYISRIYMPK